jgi:hypothetical protein
MCGRKVGFIKKADSVVRNDGGLCGPAVLREKPGETSDRERFLPRDKAREADHGQIRVVLPAT